MLRLLDLFSGIGGFALAARWAGLKTVAFVEIDPFCQKVLKKHWPEVPIIPDIREVTVERIQGIIADTEGKYNTQQEGTINTTGEIVKGQNETVWPKSGQYNGIDILVGGFPCQPFSCAGQRKGKADDRYLWPEMLRVITELRPTWIIGENVTGILSMAQQHSDPEMGCEADPEVEADADCDAGGILWGIIDDLENLGYEVQPFVIPACAVNAPHRRDRIWIVAHSGQQPTGGTQNGFSDGKQSSSEARKWANQGYGSTNEDSHASDTRDTGLQGGERAGTYDKGQTAHGSVAECNSAWDEDWYTVALRTCVRDLDDGLPGRLAGRGRANKLKALGNSIVPQVAYQIFKAIVEVKA